MSTIYARYTTIAVVTTHATSGLNRKGCAYVGRTDLPGHDERLRLAFEDPQFHTVSWSATVRFPDGYVRYTRSWPTESGAIREAKRIIRNAQKEEVPA